MNDAPVAQNGSASGSEDTPITGTVVATDVDSVTLTYALAAQAANGTVVVNSDGTYTYTPTLDFNGTDSFTFTANDGSVTSNTATVTLAVAAVNDAPVNTVPGAADRAGRYPAAHRRLVGRRRGQPDAHRDAVRPEWKRGHCSGARTGRGQPVRYRHDHRHAGRGEPGAGECATTSAIRISTVPTS